MNARETTNTDTIVGIDVGYGETKIAYAGLDTPKFTSFRCIAAPTPPGNAGLDGGLRSRQTVSVTVGNRHFEVGADAELISKADTIPGLHDDYVTTGRYHAYLHAALATVGQSRITVLVTGLPVRHFTDKRDYLVELLAGRHQVTASTAVAVDQVHVIPQPLGSLLDLSAREPDRRVAELTVLVIDPGYRTTDWLIVDRLRAVRRRSGTIPQGVKVIIDNLREHLITEHGGAPTVARLAEQIKNGRTIRVHNKPTDIGTLLRRAAEPIAEPVVEGIKNAVADFHDIDLILLTGGGAAIFQPAIENMVAGTAIDVLLPPAPELANVRGYYLFGERAAQQVMRAVR